MKCADCIFNECFMRSPLGGCPMGEKDTNMVFKPTPAVLPTDISCYANSAILDALRKVKALREAQNKHAKTLNYGYRCLAIRLGKEVDEILEKLKLTEYGKN